MYVRMYVCSYVYTYVCTCMSTLIVYVLPVNTYNTVHACIHVYDNTNIYYACISCNINLMCNHKYNIMYLHKIGLYLYGTYYVRMYYTYVTMMHMIPFVNSFL